MESSWSTPITRCRTSRDQTTAKGEGERSREVGKEWEETDGEGLWGARGIEGTARLDSTKESCQVITHTTAKMRSGYDDA